MIIRQLQRLFSGSSLAYALEAYGQPLVQEPWRIVGERAGGTLNGAYPAQNDTGAKGFLKFFSHGDDLIASATQRMIAENIVSRLANVIDLPVPANFMHIERENGIDHPCLVSIEPFPDSISLDKVTPGSLTIAQQQQLFDATSALYPFYLWLELGDLNLGGILVGKQGTRSENAVANVDFEDCGIAFWLYMKAQGDAVDFRSQRRETSAIKLALIRATHCQDIELAMQDIHDREKMLAVVNAIETMPDMILEDCVNIIPDWICSSDDKALIIEGLKTRRALLRPMLLQQLSVDGFNGPVDQAPIKTISDPWRMGRISDKRHTSGIIDELNQKDALRDTAASIGANIIAGEFRKAAELFRDFQQHHAVAHDDLENLHMLYELLEEQNVMAVPYGWDESGVVSQVALIYPDTTSPLNGLLPFTTYALTTVNLANLSQIVTMESARDCDDESLMEALETGFGEVALRNPFHERTPRARQEAQIPCLPRGMCSLA